MKTATAEYARAVAAGSRPVIEVRSWLGAEDLGLVPVVTGTWQVRESTDDQVPGEVTFSVPNLPDWRAGGIPDHPLGQFGQQLEVRVGSQMKGADEPELLPQGWFRITDVVPNGDVIDVTGTGLLCLVQQARFLAPYTAAKAASRQAVIKKILQGILPVAFDGVADETFPGGTWDRERIDALYEVVQGWPARVWVDETGTVVVSPVWSDRLTSADVSILDGPGGSLVEVTMAPTPETAFNGYVVSTVPEGDEAPVTGKALLASGPMRWGGPYGYRPGFYASPVLKPVVSQLTSVATAMVQRARRRAETMTITALPDARVEVGDVVRVRSQRQSVDRLARVTERQLTRTQLQLVAAWTGSAV